ncbi:uncharacterized protein LOC130347132 [Hyla sarda]|uniref:uncharacterized protein LOC130347132 n=1 Tax=Hyla sarda TaxID=327740 RepID=UPI0024C36F68|nr:uncharacterized protein LOC130347132 [Hyla sarda]
MSDLTKTRDEDGIWTGGWKVLVKLRQINNITQHLPNSFFIGREKGVCFYAGQPRKCFKCGKTGHIASVCTLVKCNLCGEIGHVSATCQNIRCNLCGKTGHSHRDCPDAWHNICKDFPDEDLLEGAEDLEEETLVSGSAVTQPEPQHNMGDTRGDDMGDNIGDTSGDNMGDNIGDTVPDQSQPGATEGNREVTEQVVAMSSSAPASINPQKRRKKDKTSRKPEEGWTTVQKPSKKKVDPGSGVMTITNRYSVLSESDVEEEMERELKRVIDEFNEDQEGDPPTKKRPPRAKRLSESDMETSGQQEGSDSDL